MKKSVGFRRDIKASWFDAAASLRYQTSDVDELRRRLDEALSSTIEGDENRSITVQVLLRIWAKPEPEYLELHREAVDRFFGIDDPRDRIWLHYGLSLLAYPFFRDATGYVGAILRQRGFVTNALLKQRIIANSGQLGSLENASKAVMFALRQWGMLVPGQARGEYLQGAQLATNNRSLEEWFIRAVLTSRVESTAVAQDIFNWPPLFPFRFTMTPFDLRGVEQLDVLSQGSGLDVVSIQLPHRVRSKST